MKLSEQYKLRVFKSGMLKKIFGLKKDEEIG
jgi:hypothetical protein